MKILIFISIYLLSSLNAGNIRFIDSVYDFPSDDDPSLTEIDKATKYFLTTNGANFKDLNKQIVKRLNIKKKGSRNRNIINIKGVKYHCGNYIYSDQRGPFNNMYDTFHENSLVEVYSMFNVIYAIKTHGETEFVLSVKDDLFTYDEIKSRNLDGYRAIKVDDVPQDPPKTLFRKFKQYSAYIYPTIPAIASIIFYAKYANALNNSKATTTDYEVTTYYYNESVRQKNYAILAGVSSVAIAIPLNWNHIKRLWKN